ncbi:hypothetical protein KUTeg_023271 [Tegillarca granosa]|uniref:PAS domain-containing protein n=1 Tax=Tegillarca granosa TaxID=220873 RepID=A0ABQ9E152_TEGGR|nr:hypothetical protein KUTeg_023271 [Tegillarca granosa]
MSKMDVNDQDDSDDNCNLSCLVAIGQVKSPSDQMNIRSDIDSINLRPIEYTSRHSIDGKFTYIDQGATVLLGYLPQELLGTSVYEYYHQDDIMEMAEVHRKVLKTKEKFKTNVYRFKSKDGSFLHLRSVCFSFRNPWTKEVEYIVSKNTVVPVQEVSSSGQSVDAGGVTMELNEDSVDDTEGVESRHLEKHRLQIPGLPGGTRPGAGRIGRQIADEILELQKYGSAPPTDTNLIENVMAEQSVIEEMNVSGNDGNDEAAMSIIMSLLEADAGLGGPIDFNDLPWPL